MVSVLRREDDEARFAIDFFLLLILVSLKLMFQTSPREKREKTLCSVEMCNWPWTLSGRTTGWHPLGLPMRVRVSLRLTIWYFRYFPVHLFKERTSRWLPLFISNWIHSTNFRAIRPPCGHQAHSHSFSSISHCIVDWCLSNRQPLHMQ